MDNNTGKDRERNQMFLSLLMRQQRKIYAFIASLVINAADADDVMQETVSVMWDKFDSFEPGTNFSAWSMQIAHYMILRHRRDKATCRFQFTDDAFLEIMERVPFVITSLDERVDALQSCLGKLSEKDRKIIAMRYEKEITPKVIAERIGRTVGAVYKALARTHDILQKCVNNTINAWEANQ